MNIRNFLFVCGLGVMLNTGCKDDKNPPVTTEQESTVEKVTTLFNLHKKAAQVYQNQISIDGDTVMAMDALGQWLLDQPEVKEAHYVGLNLVEIYLKNGLRTDITVIPVDEDGQHLIRGGESGKSSLNMFSSDEEIKEIKNSKVLILIPFIDEFYYGHYDKKVKFKGGNSNAPQPEDVTVISGTDVTLSTLESLSSSGLIILNTHGVSDGFLLNMKDDGFDLADTVSFSDEDIREFIISTNNIPVEKLASGELRLSSQFEHDISTHKINGIHARLTVTEEYVRNMNIDLSNSVLFANHCFSGWVADGKTENNMSEAWLSKGLSTYYGYAYENGSSAPVGNNFCKQMEDSLIVNLVVETDTTGVAHLAKDAIFQYELLPTLVKRGKAKKLVPLTSGGSSSFEYVESPLYFYQYFDDNYQYVDCKPGTITDTRDGKTYKTVCIGGQLWMAENLRYSGAGVCFDNEPANCEKEGRLYSVFEVLNEKVSDDSNTVQGICPKGWHVPSEKEYTDLMTFCGGTQSAIVKLRSKDWPSAPTSTDEFGFNLVPAQPAYYSLNDKKIVFNTSSRVQAQLWTSSGNPQTDSYKLFETRSTTIMKILGTSQTPESAYYTQCRCVQDN